ncbi:MAG: hypothetical protein WAS36_00125 [Candidatus Saccharimonadales bacterium]
MDAKTKHVLGIEHRSDDELAQTINRFSSKWAQKIKNSKYLN